MATNTKYQPAVYHTGVVRGDKFGERFEFKTKDGSNPLSGALRARIHLRDSSGRLVEEFSLGDGIFISDNVLSWFIEANKTKTYSPGTFNYDIEITVGSSVRTYVAGSFTVKKDYTI